jgi:D-amino-acid oxidase
MYVIFVPVLSRANEQFEEVVATAESPLPAGLPHGHKFSSYVIDAPKYTQYLGEKVRSKGIPIVRKKLTSLDQAYNTPEFGRVGLVVNATGLGSKGLIGVEDSNLYPARGQTVLVKAPKVKTCVMRADQFLANMTAKPGASTDTGTLSSLH